MGTLTAVCQGGGGYFFRHDEFQPWLPERNLRPRESESRIYCSVLVTSERQIGTGRNSPPKETNLLLEVLLEHIRSMYIHSVRQILTQLRGFGSLGVHSSGAEIFPAFSLKAFILLRSFLSRVLPFSQHLNCVSSEEAAARQAHSVPSASVGPVLPSPGRTSAELSWLQSAQPALQACPCPVRAHNWCNSGTKIA